MESLESLKARKRDLEEELESITIKKHGSTPWSPGVQDQFDSYSYTHNEYTDVSRAYTLIDEIKDLDRQIKTYAQRVQAEEFRKETYLESQTPKYEYTRKGEVFSSENPAIAARYNAQNRLFGMNKLEQTIAKVTGQKRKFKKLWIKAATDNEKTREEVALELNRMFR